jgi:ribosomal protein S12 methylthiotransferase accessory factor
MRYALTLWETASSTGYFAPIPADHLPEADALSYLKTHPFDTFMHGYLLNLLQDTKSTDVERMVAEEKNEAALALLYEAVLLYDAFSHLRHRFSPSIVSSLAYQSPMVYIRSSQLPDQILHGKWMRLFRANIHYLKPFPPPTEINLPPPASMAEPTPRLQSNNRTAESLHIDSFQNETSASGISIEKRAREILERLDQLKILEGDENRHVASLSPIALLQKWRLQTAVHCGRHQFFLSGIQTAYGRGQDAWSARIGYAMEVAERFSAFATIEHDSISETLKSYPIIQGCAEALAKKGFSILDPNQLRLEVPYTQNPLYWMEGEMSQAGTPKPMWVPVQTVFLFSNLDELNLFSGFGSTGLAAGNSRHQARLSALLECVERDADAVTPFDPSRCFRVVADDPDLSALFQDYRNRGIHVGCQDITTENGIPAFRCFVVGMNGQVARGTGAHLNGKRALLSALTETPYPYPYGPPSLPFTDEFPIRRIETLPNLETGNEASDLSLAESLLADLGLYPIYVDLTRRDLSIPVVRALVPGLEMVNDFDFLSRVSPRLFANYLKMVALK